MGGSRLRQDPLGQREGWSPPQQQVPGGFLGASSELWELGGGWEVGTEPQTKGLKARSIFGHQGKAGSLWPKLFLQKASSPDEDFHAPALPHLLSLTPLHKFQVLHPRWETATPSPTNPADPSALCTKHPPTPAPSTVRWVLLVSTKQAPGAPLAPQILLCNFHLLGLPLSGRCPGFQAGPGQILLPFGGIWVSQPPVLLTFLTVPLRPH